MVSQKVELDVHFLIKCSIWKVQVFHANRNSSAQLSFGFVAGGHPEKLVEMIGNELNDIATEKYWCKKINLGVVVAQLTERSLPTPEIRSSNPNVDDKIFCTYLSVNSNPKKTKMKKKRLGMAYLKRKEFGQLQASSLKL